MLIKKSLITISLLLSIVFSAVAQSSSPISEEQVITIATQEFINKGGEPEKIEKITAVFVEEYGIWSVLFSSKPTSGGGYVIGNDVIAHVSSDGSKIRFRSVY